VFFQYGGHDVRLTLAAAYSVGKSSFGQSGWR